MGKVDSLSESCMKVLADVTFHGEQEKEAGYRGLTIIPGFQRRSASEGERARARARSGGERGKSCGHGSQAIVVERSRAHTSPPSLFSVRGWLVGSVRACVRGEGSLSRARTYLRVPSSPSGGSSLRTRLDAPSSGSLRSMRGTGTGRHGNGARHAQRTNDPPRSCVSACSRSPMRCGVGALRERSSMSVRGCVVASVSARLSLSLSLFVSLSGDRPLARSLTRFLSFSYAIS